MTRLEGFVLHRSFHLQNRCLVGDSQPAAATRRFLRFCGGATSISFHASPCIRPTNMSSTTRFTTNVLRTLTLATVTPFTIYSLEAPKPDHQSKALPHQENLPPVNISSAPASYTITVVRILHSCSVSSHTNLTDANVSPQRDQIIAFLDFVNKSGIPWTILGGLLVAVGMLGVQAVGSRLKWVYNIRSICQE